MPHVPNRRLVWIARLVFYPAALALIALALHARLADAGADGGAGFVPVAPALPPTPVTLAGPGAHGDPVTATVRAGVPTELELPMHFRCTPGRGDVWAVFTQTPDTVAGGRLRIDHRAVATTWPSGWRGRTDLQLSGTYTAKSITATLRGRLTLHSGGGRTARCRAKPVRFVLREPHARRRGSTAQGERIFVTLVGRNVQMLSTVMRVTCRGPAAANVGRKVWWTRVVRAGSGRLRGARTTTAIQQTATVTGGGDGTEFWVDAEDLPERATAGDGDRTTAFSQADVRLDARGVLRGRLFTTLTLPATGPGQGGTCQTPPGGVSFALPGRPAAGR
jgi:hypothetical protein